MSNHSAFDFSNRVFRLAALCVLIFAVYGSASALASWRSYTGLQPKEMTLEGFGKVTISPDVAILTAGVTSEGADSVNVVKENAEKINAIFAELVNKGIKREDIKTANYYLNPRYGYSPEKGSFKDGYVLDQSFEVKVRDLTKVGEIIADVSKAGANIVSGVNFIIEDENAFLEKARALAIADVKKKADKISEQTGLRIGRVVNFSEWREGVVEPYDFRSYSASKQVMDGSFPDPNIQPGQTDVKLRVNLTYSLK